MIPVIGWKTLECDNFLRKISTRGSESDPQIEARVAEILAAVRQRGDAALLEFTRQFDGVLLSQVRIDPAELRELASQVDPALRESLHRAAENIRRFHLKQMETSWTMEAGEGVRLGQRISPLRSVGLYVPGGTAAYPSTVLMNAIPAQIAGVPRIAVVTPYRQLRRNPAIASVLLELGLEEVYGVGGAQAVAALAYGTQSLPRVDKIVGPGNIYVATAKRRVYGTVDIDMIAGPSEVVVVADDSADSDCVAADLMAQAEHDPDACAVAVVFSGAMAERIQASLQKLIRRLNRHEIIRQALGNFGALLLVSNEEEAAEAVNCVAPEHLELFTANPESFSEKIHSAGAIFYGEASCEAVGDYFAGPNHVLPTSGTARFASPLGVYDFLKRTSLIYYTRTALARDRAHVERIARAEQLDAHALSVSIRFEK